MRLYKTGEHRRTDLRAGDIGAKLITNSASRRLTICIHGGGCNSGYFAIGHSSFLAAALRQDHAVLLVDRPGHGESAPSASKAWLDETAAAVPGLACRALEILGGSTESFGVVGHSIGAAVALELAARDRQVGAAAISGLGQRPTAEALRWVRENPASTEPPHSFFFGPEGTYDWRAPLALRKIAEPWKTDEIDYILFDWPKRLEELGKTITAPIQVALSENERIWCSDSSELERLRTVFPLSIETHVLRLQGGGHLYELHKAGSRLISEQLKFLNQHLK